MARIQNRIFRTSNRGLEGCKPIADEAFQVTASV